MDAGKKTPVVGKVKDNRKKAMIAGAVAVLLLAVFIIFFVAPRFKTAEMVDVVDLRGDKAKIQILKTGISEDRVVFKEIEDGKAIADCKDYKRDIHRCFVVETDPASGSNFHLNTDNVNVGVKSAENMARETVGGNPDQLIALADKYGFDICAYNSFHKSINNLIKSNPSDWTITEIGEYDSKKNSISYTVTGTKEYEEKIREEEKARWKEEEEKKAEEEKKKAEEEAAKKEENKTEEEKNSSEKDQYYEYKKYLSSFKVIDGGGYTVVVDSRLKGDFTSLKNCALYTMRKAYKELGTMDMGVYGDFGDGEPAFYYDSNAGNTIFVQEDYIVPPGWEWALLSHDIAYIKGEE